MGRRGGCRFWRWVIAALLGSVLAGCQAPIQLGPVEVMLRSADGNWTVLCAPIEDSLEAQGGFVPSIAWKNASDAIDKHAQSYRLELMATPLLLVSLDHAKSSSATMPATAAVESAPASAPTTGPAKPPPPGPFAFMYEGQSRLEFEYHEPVLLANGTPVAIDATDPFKFLQWAQQATPEQLRSIRSVKLSGDIQFDWLALRLLGPLNCPVLDFTRYENELPQALATAAAAMRAAGLIVPDLPGREALLARMGQVGSLKYLVTAGSCDGLRPVLPQLALLAVDEAILPEVSGSPSLDWLKHGSRLRVLKLMVIPGEAEKALMEQAQTQPASAPVSEPKAAMATDFSPLARLRQLRVLVLSPCSYLPSLEVLRPLHHLQELVLVSCYSLQDVSALGQLTELRAVTLLSTGSEKKLTGLARLKRLKKCRLIMLDKERLTSQQAELDEIRVALPDCRIEGFAVCLGSRWIWLVAAGGLAGGALWRRLRQRKLAIARTG